MKTNYIIITVLIVSIIVAIYLGVDLSSARNRLNRALRLSTPNNRVISASSTAQNTATVVGATDPGQTHQDVHNPLATSEGKKSSHQIYSGASSHAPAVGSILSGNTGVYPAYTLNQEDRDERRKKEGSEVAVDSVTTVAAKKNKHTEAINASKFNTLVHPNDNHRELYMRDQRRHESVADRIVGPGNRKTNVKSDSSGWGYGLYDDLDTITTTKSNSYNTSSSDSSSSSSQPVLLGQSMNTNTPVEPSWNSGGFGRDEASRHNYHHEQEHDEPRRRRFGGIFHDINLFTKEQPSHKQQHQQQPHHQQQHKH